jgi:diguanylate cyclase (GGDEF)-like protein
MTKHTLQHNILTFMGDAGNYELQRALVNAVIDASPDGILVVDEHAKIVSHNQQFVEIWRIPSECLRGAEAGTAIGADDRPILAHNLAQVKDEQAFLARVKLLYDNPQLKDHCEIELKDGRTLERHSTVLWNDDGVCLGRVWFFRDISQQKQTEYTLRDLAHQDSLTGVPNRRFFLERANQELARSKRRSAPLSVAILDVDHFKQINDHSGHAVGDEVLKLLCNASQSILREEDIFARLGGEEFVVLLPDTNLEGAAVLAERLRQAIAANKLLLSSGEINCTVSIGVAILKSTDTGIEECLMRADSAMYKAKQKGRNRVEIDT